MEITEDQPEFVQFFLDSNTDELDLGWKQLEELYREVYISCSPGFHINND